MRAVDKWIQFLTLRDGSQGRKNLYIIIIIIIIITTCIYLEILLPKSCTTTDNTLSAFDNFQSFYCHIHHTPLSTITSTFHSTTVSVTTRKNSSHKHIIRDNNTAHSSFWSRNYERKSWRHLCIMTTADVVWSAALIPASKTSSPLKPNNVKMGSVTLNSTTVHKCL